MAAAKFENIMIPLDGSEFGEQALTATLPLAKAARAKIHLVHVQEDPGVDPKAQGAADYMQSMASKVTAETGLEVNVALLTDTIGGATFAHPPRGAIADILTRYADSNDIDLISLPTHGRGGLSRAWLGSVADSLVRQSAIPVLLHRAGEVWKGELKRILITLDGSKAAECVIPIAAALGRPTGAEYTLLLVTPFYPAVLDAETPAYAYTVARATELAQQADLARAYLETVAQPMRLDGLGVSAKVVEAMDVAHAINKFAADGEFDLQVTATRGLGGGSRLLLGSVADKVARTAVIPVLICNSGRATDDSPPKAG
jgi:nucleotide-binding universal stress UspA family protein